MGIHHDSWIELSQKTVLEGYNLSHVLSHEVGHVLDYDFEEPPFYASRTKEYKEKFIKFKELTLSLLNKYNNKYHTGDKLLIYVNDEGALTPVILTVTGISSGED